MSNNVLNLNPAILTQPGAVPEVLYLEEFQDTLSSWFEKHGVVTSLRIHLRNHLINVLKDCASVKLPDVLPTIPFKSQAIHLLFAEFLLKNKYYHALSVLSIEVPLVSIISEFIPHSKLSQLNRNINTKQFQLNETKIWDILTVFGFEPFSKQAQIIHEAYLNSIEQPLIVHIINNLCTVNANTNKDSHQNDTFDIENVESLLKAFDNILLRFTIPQNTSLYLVQYLKILLEQLVTKIKGDELFKFNELQTQIQRNVTDKEHKITSLINEIENNFITEKQELVETLEKEQQKFMIELKQRKHEYSNKIESLKEKEKLVKKRENKLLKTLQQLEDKEIQLLNIKQQITDAQQIENQTKDTTIKEIQQNNQQLQLKIEQQQQKIDNLLFSNKHLNTQLEQTKITVTKLLKTKPETKYSDYKMDKYDKSDPIDEIVRETKQRLDKLQIETQILDQSFRDYKLRKIQN